MEGIKPVTHFLASNEDRFSFEWLSAKERQVLLSAIAAALCASGEASTEERLACLQALRLLSRDKSCCAAVVATDGEAEQPGLLMLLLSASGLTEYIDSGGDIVMIQDGAHFRAQTEALKCLCNLVYNNEDAQAFCSKNNVANAIIQRSRTYEVASVDYQIKLFDMRLLFIITAFCTEVRRVACLELKGLSYLPDVLEALLTDINTSCHLDDAAVELAVQVLKALYNLTICLSSGLPLPADEGIELQTRRLVSLTRRLLSAKTKSEEKRIELTNHLVNLMVNIQPAFYDELLLPMPVQHVGVGFAQQAECEASGGISTSVIDILLHFLHYKLKADSAHNSLSSIIPVMAVLTTFARVSPPVRRHCRLKVLPYLKDEVKQLPQEGNSLRNRLCALLTVPNTDISCAAAEFLYVLCKESVSRLIKYSGFGNAAGLLAQRGLMCSSQTKRGYGNTSGHSSDSEDSETEEYRELEPDVNPVTGRWEPTCPGSKTMDEMTDEQKEYEAVKLADLMHKLTEHKVIQPAMIGSDGQVKAVEHVLELTASMAMPSDSSESD